MGFSEMEECYECGSPIECQEHPAIGLCCNCWQELKDEFDGAISAEEESS